jgi:CHAD domain-containing protein
VPFRFLSGESVEDGSRRIATEQVDRALTALTNRGSDAHEGIHDARRRCKKVRAVCRLVRSALGDTYDAENRRFRDAGRLVAHARDATAVIETFDEQLAEPFADQLDDDRLEMVRNVLVERRAELRDGMDLGDRIDELVDTLRAGREAMGDWALTRDGWDAIAPGLAKTYGRGRRRMGDAYDEPTTAAFHEWRKRVKYHRYHMGLLRELWPQPMNARRKSCRGLTDLLGDDHDLAVLRGVLERESGRFDQGDLRVLVAVVDRRRAELQARARAMGKRVFAEAPEGFTDRLGAYWATWRADRADPDTTPALATGSAA